MKCLLITLSLWLLAACAHAQVRPGAFTTLVTTDTSSNSICVGCTVGGSTPSGTVNAASLTGTLTTASQTAITGVGTLTVGTWNATTIATTKGGTGLTSYSQGDLVYASAANTLASLAKSTSGTKYLSNTGANNGPAWADVTATVVTITDDTTTNATEYPVFVAAASGSQTTYVSSSKLTWNPSAGSLGIGVTPSTPKLYILSTTEQERLAYDVNNYLSTTVNSVGIVGWTATAGSGNGGFSFNPTGTGSLTVTSHQTTGNGVLIDNATLTSGGLLTVNVSSTAAASSSQTALGVFTNGTNSNAGQITYGAQITNSHAGTTSTNVGLQINTVSGTTANYALLVQAGRVGVGTLTPESVVNVADTASAGIRGIVLDQYNAGTEAARFQGRKSRGASVGTQTIVQSGDTLMNLLAYGSDGTAFVSAASITFSVDGTPGVNDMPGRIEFLTSPDGSATPASRMKIDNAGKVYLTSAIGTGVGDNAVCILSGSTYELIRSNGAGACTTSSWRFKQDIEDAPYGLREVLQMRPVTYRYRPERHNGDALRLGFIAEDMREVVPEVVGLDDAGQPYSLDYPALVPVLTKAIQELDARLRALEAK